MHSPNRVLAMGIALAAVTISCSVPTEKAQSIEVRVLLSDSLTANGVLGQGDREQLFAYAFQLSAGGDTIKLPNVELVWDSDNDAIATVEGFPGGHAQVTGVGFGNARISAQAVAFESGGYGDTLIRVAPSFIIDSVRPRVVRYGQRLTVYGVGLPSIFALNLGGGELEPDPFSFVGSNQGLGQRDYWVPFPAASSLPVSFVFGANGLTLTQWPNDSITVDPQDIFEPDTTVPGIIDISGPGFRQPFGGDTLPVLFYNPALYFEPQTTGSSDIDWARFDRNDAAAVTLIVLSNVFGDTAYSFVSDSLYQCGPNPSICYDFPVGWYFTAGLQFCNGIGFSYLQPRVPSYAISFRKWPTPRLHLLQFYAKEGRYTLAAVRGYLRADRAIPPDRFEDNQLCWQADSNFADPPGPGSRQIQVGFGVPFADSLLTISQLYDVDFYRFRVNPPAFPFDTLLTIQTKARTFGGVDPSDIDVYLYDASGNFLGQSFNLASDEQITVTAGPGEYYAVVADYAGAPTVYSMCIVRGTSCSPPGSAPPATVTARPRAKPRPSIPAPATDGFDPRRLSPRK